MQIFLCLHDVPERIPIFICEYNPQFLVSDHFLLEI